MKTLKIQAKSNHRNVLEVDQSNADLLIARGDWELVPETDKSKEDEVTEDGNGSKPAGRRRAPRAARSS